MSSKHKDFKCGPVLYAAKMTKFSNGAEIIQHERALQARKVGKNTDQEQNDPATKNGKAAEPVVSILSSKVHLWQGTGWSGWRAF